MLAQLSFMRHIHHLNPKLFSPFLLLGLILFAAGCSDSTVPEPGPVPTPDPVDIAENVKVIDDEELDLQSITGGKYTYDIIGSKPTIEIGDVIVGQRDGGYLRRVVGITRYPERLELETTSASLPEVFNNADVNMVLRPYGPNTNAEMAGQASREAKVKDLAKGVSLDEGLINLDNLLIFLGAVPLGTTNLEASIETGQISTDPSIELGFTIIDSQLQSMKAIYSDTTTFECTALVSADGLWGPYGPPETKLFTSIGEPHLNWIWIIPVIWHIETTSYIGITSGVSAEAEMRFTAETRTCSRVGLEYTKGSWADPIWEFTKTDASPQLTVEAEVEALAHIYFRQEISLILYLAAGPSFGIEPYVDFAKTFSISDFQATWCNDLYVGCNAGLGVSASSLWDIPQIPLLISPLFRERVIHDCSSVGGVVSGEDDFVPVLLK